MYSSLSRGERPCLAQFTEIAGSWCALHPVAGSRAPIAGIAVSAAFLFGAPERLDPAVELSPKRLPAVVQRQVCWLHPGQYAVEPGLLVSAKHSEYVGSA